MKIRLDTIGAWVEVFQTHYPFLKWTEIMMALGLGMDQLLVLDRPDLIPVRAAIMDLLGEKGDI